MVVVEGVMEIVEKGTERRPGDGHVGSSLEKGLAPLSVHTPSTSSN